MSVFAMISPKDWRTSVRAVKDYEVKRLYLVPSQWSAYPNRLPSLTWQSVKFDATGVNTLPNKEGGVYSFVAEPRIAGHKSVGYLLYIGETHKQSLRARCTDYLAEINKPK